VGVVSIVIRSTKKHRNDATRYNAQRNKAARETRIRMKIIMEAFLVTVYTNNYEHWNQDVEEGGMRQVRLSGRKRKQDCSGWTDAGVALYKNFAKEIRVIRHKIAGNDDGDVQAGRGRWEGAG
jgi:hypothetical protein